jgi:iron complex outermembrane receptor protein
MLASVSGLVLLGLGPQAQAQTQPESIEEVLVTASRISRGGFEAPTPTTVSSREEIEKTGATNVADFLNTLPAFSGGITPQQSVRSTQNAGGNFLNLRGIGTNRTLVLVEGRRHVPTTAGGLIDTNVVPSGLVERIEIVTGGASAAWGSDAVAGVVNIILKKDLEGVEASFEGGETKYGDGQTYRTSVAYGRGFAEGRGRVTVAAEYADSKGLDTNSKREWVQRRYGLVLNPLYAVGNGQDRLLIASDVGLSTAAIGGLITAGPLRGLQFLPNGQTRQFQYGTYVGTTAMVGGDGTNIGAEQTPLSTPLERANIYGRATFDVTENVQAFLEMSYAYSRTRFPLSAHRDLAAITIRRDNAFLPASVAALMDANRLTTFTMGRLSPDTGMNITDNRNGTERYVAGFTGKIFDDWTWNAHYEHGKTRYSNRVSENRINANYTLAIDAVRNAAGQIVCRSTLTAPTNGCVPMNLFGEGSPSAEALAYVRGTQVLLAHVKEDAAAANIEGEPFELWAGKVSLAAGIEFRREAVEQEVDALSLASAFAIGNPKPLEGSYKVTEGYVETVVPLLKDAPLAKSLDFNGAVRVTHYSTSGTVTSWKAGLTYDITDDLRLRVTRSRDIRAPNLGELYSSYVLTFSQVNDPVTGANLRVGAPSEGNTDLKPERADTTTFGVVYQPGWAPGLRASVDFYDIQVEDVISTVSAQEILNRCFAGNAALCGFIDRDAAGVVQTVTRKQVNLSELSTSGIDFEVSYSRELSDVVPNWQGRASIRGLATYVREMITDDGIVRLDRAGDATDPHWKANVTTTYDVGAFSAFLQGQYIGGGKYDQTYGEFDINDNSVPSQFLLHAQVAYTLLDRPGQRIQMFGTVRNLLDQKPPPYPTSGALNAITLTTFNLAGREYRAGFRLKF